MRTVAGHDAGAPDGVRGGAKELLGQSRHGAHDVGVEADTGHHEEVALVGSAEVEVPSFAVEKNLHGGFRRAWDADFSSEDVAHAATQDAEGAGRVGEAVNDLVDGAVTTTCKDDAGAGLGRFSGELDAVAGGLGHAQLDLPAFRSEGCGGGFETSTGRRVTRRGIQDDNGTLHRASIW